LRSSSRTFAAEDLLTTPVFVGAVVAEVAPAGAAGDAVSAGLAESHADNTILPRRKAAQNALEVRKILEFMMVSAGFNRTYWDNISIY
jgi:hypothetical protein